MVSAGADCYAQSLAAGHCSTGSALTLADGMTVQIARQTLAVMLGNVVAHCQCDRRRGVGGNALHWQHWHNVAGRAGAALAALLRNG